jgi:transcription elongation factor GreB
MNKAFTKETDHDDELSLLPEMPTGVPNYITPAGFLALQNQLRELIAHAPADGAFNAAGQTRSEIEQRIHYLQSRIESAQVVNPAVHVGNEQIFFGATVTYQDEADELHTVTIVGLDELDPANGKISWLSPVAQALLNANEGDTVEMDGPAGLEELTIMAVDYLHASS